MGTTSNKAAHSVLKAMERAGVSFAILHKEEELARGDIPSDIDIAIGEDYRCFRRKLTDRLGEQELFVVMEWPPTKDVEATSVLIANVDASEGVHLDVSHSRSGLGAYGVRAGVAASRSVPGERWPRLDEHDEWTYLLRKRQRKRDTAKVTALRASEPPPPDAREPLLRAPGMSWHRTGQLLARLLVRLRRPVGLWVHTDQPALAAEVVERFGAFLPVAVQRNRPRSAGGCALLRLDRLRPRLIVTAGAPVVGRWRPDLVLLGGDLDTSSRQIVSYMRKRADQ